MWRFNSSRLRIFVSFSIRETPRMPERKTLPASGATKSTLSPMPRADPTRHPRHSKSSELANSYLLYLIVISVAYLNLLTGVKWSFIKINVAFLVQMFAPLVHRSLRWAYRSLRAC